MYAAATKLDALELLSVQPGPVRKVRGKPAGSCFRSGVIVKVTTSVGVGPGTQRAPLGSICIQVLAE